MNQITGDPSSKYFAPQRTNIIESFYSGISKYISPIFIKYNFSANIVTIISGLFGIAGSLIIILNSIESNILSFLFLNIFVVLDLVDGDIARHTKTTSYFGRWLDLFFDKINEILLILSLIYISYIHYPHQSILLAGLVLLTMHLCYQYLILANLYWFSNISNHSSEINQDQKGNKVNSLGNYILLHLTMKHATLFFISSIFILFGEYKIALFVLSIVATYSVVLTCLGNFIRLNKK